MLQLVDLGLQSLEPYERSVGKRVIAELRRMAAPLRDARILHLNATSYGGGVAELLRSEVPLLRDLGVDAEWRVLTGTTKFFKTTKSIHNALQGDPRGLDEEQKRIYVEHLTEAAAHLGRDYDIVVIHDPQPLALRGLVGGDAKWIWRCHIDTSEPNAAVWSWLSQYLRGYDAAVFTLGSFVPPDCPIERVEIIPPAIDPESPKNFPITLPMARRVLGWLGIAPERPLVTQVSRFDKWKDPLGVIAAHKIVQRARPNVQLALVGSMALDDPEGWEVYREIEAAAHDDPSIHIFTNLSGVGNIEVNAFQRLSDVVIQKSIREGFGLVVSEALWKGTPVVAGRAGGIPIQLSDGAGGFLVESVEECAERTLFLLENPEQAHAIAEQGRAVVKNRFLLTRLMADEMRLFAAVLDRRASVPAVTQVGLTHETRDPVCGVRVDPAVARSCRERDTVQYFCSKTCQQEFATNPDRFFRGAIAR